MCLHGHDNDNKWFTFNLRIQLFLQLSVFFLQVAVIVKEIDSVEFFFVFFTCPVRQLQQTTIMGLDALVTNMINFTKAEL